MVIGNAGHTRCSDTAKAFAHRGTAPTLGPGATHSLEAARSPDRPLLTEADVDALVAETVQMLEQVKARRERWAEYWRAFR